MNNTYKYILLFLGFLTILSAMFYSLSILKDTNIEFQKSILIKQAQTHFKDQVNNRKWSANYGGVYAKPMDGQKPNPYLSNNTLKTEDGETLIKINPAWMTRQLSELLETEDFHFRITSLNPINPTNQADDFETEALKYIERTNEKEYYKITDNKGFRYMGALVTIPSCIPCHQHQGYRVGDIRGGISIELNTKDYQEVVSYTETKIFLVQVVIFLLLLSITFLLYKQIKNNDNLQEEVNNRTKEILNTKQLLQKILDTDKSFLMVSDETEIILANKTMLNFFSFDSLESFKKNYSHISDAFVNNYDNDFLCTYVDDEHWIKYLQREQHQRDIKVLMRKDGVDRYFKPHSKEIHAGDRLLNVIIFDEITQSFNTINALKDVASRDPLTNLFNRRKFNDILSSEMNLSQTTNTPLSIIFLDIDHFKLVNDTFGHDVGDNVLIELSNILLNSTRKGDFVSRWGGEEFVITLQSTEKEEALLLAEKIRLHVEKYNFTNGGKQTISLGVTDYRANETQESFTKRVDEALYEAKNSGRNRVVIK